MYLEKAKELIDTENASADVLGMIELITSADDTISQLEESNNSLIEENRKLRDLNIKSLLGLSAEEVEEKEEKEEKEETIKSFDEIKEEW